MKVKPSAVITLKSSILLLFAAALCIASAASADTLYLKDGRTLEGHVVSQDDENVVFNAQIGKVKATLTFPMSEVLKIEEGEVAAEDGGEEEAGEEEEPELPGYFVIPVTGTIGLNSTAPVLDECLTIGERFKPELIILKINSGGGAVRELQQMIKTLEEHKETRIVAYVEKAYSAAAVLAMSCKEIIINPKGTIGGAVVFQIGPAGTPFNIEEKFESILRAEFRSAVVRAEHNPLILEGMMQTDCILSLKETDEGVEVVEGKVRNGKVIKPRGKILTMTADESVSCALVLATAETIHDCNKILEIEEWRVLPDAAKRIVERWENEVNKAESDYTKLMKETEHLVEMARANDPSLVPPVRTESGSLAPGVKREQQKRAVICVRCLKKAEDNLKKLSKIAADYPGLVGMGKIEYSEEMLEMYQEHIASLRRIIQAITPR
ncbi:MAG: Clp protease/crotonase-like domain-containing protein [Planctomycetota bacterium]|jgi:ATP-dependent protease ClpP protease subunit